MATIKYTSENYTTCLSGPKLEVQTHPGSKNLKWLSLSDGYYKNTSENYTTCLCGPKLEVEPQKSNLITDTYF
jgi:hypothetical protein